MLLHYHTILQHIFTLATALSWLPLQQCLWPKHVATSFAAANTEKTQGQMFLFPFPYPWNWHTKGFSLGICSYMWRLPSFWYHMGKTLGWKPYSYTVSLNYSHVVGAISMVQLGKKAEFLAAVSDAFVHWLLLVRHSPSLTLTHKMLYRRWIWTKYFPSHGKCYKMRRSSVRGPRERRMGIINNYHNYHTEVVTYCCCTCRLTRE